MGKNLITKNPRLDFCFSIYYDFLDKGREDVKYIPNKILDLLMLDRLLAYMVLFGKGKSNTGNRIETPNWAKRAAGVIIATERKLRALLWPFDRVRLSQTPPVQPADTSSSYPRNIGYFDPDPGQAPVQVKQSYNIYHNVFSFTNRLRVKADVLDVGVLRQNVDSCLLGAADNWYVNQLSHLARLGLGTTKMALSNGAMP